MTGAIGRVRQRLHQWWDEVRRSTDANLLGVLRIFGLLYGPIERRARIDVAFRNAMRYRLAPHVGWRHALGGVTYLLLMVLVVTGVLLSFYYRPSAQEAYPSIQHIVSSVPFGWLVRDVHVWAGSLVVLFAFAHVIRVWVTGAYKAPRETNWLAGLGLLAVVLAFGVSGYLLPWDQWAYWTVSEGLDAVARAPVVGGLVAELLQGDDVVSGATLSRFFALHVILLPWLLLGLSGLHFSLVRKHGVAPPRDGAPAGPGVRFYQVHLMRMVATAAIVLAVTISLAALVPRPVGPPADPGMAPATLPPTWVAMPAWRALVLGLGGGAVAILVLAGVGLLLLPLLDRSPETRLRHRPVALVVGLFCFGGALLAGIAGRALTDRAPHITTPAATPAVPFGATPEPPAVDTAAAREGTP
jgi:quinol-cytochrome oxidoreductase complex cytochrome b subunit